MTITIPVLAKEKPDGARYLIDITLTVHRKHTENDIYGCGCRRALIDEISWELRPGVQWAMRVRESYHSLVRPLILKYSSQRY